MLEFIFLWVLALIWIIFAVIQDLKSHEIANWLNFSLIIFALGYRFFYSLFSVNWNFFYQGIFGLAIFFALGNILYYGKMFAGGDAKLMVAFGAILPSSLGIHENINLFLEFLLIFFIVGAIYTLVASLSLVLKNFQSFKKEWKRQFKINRKIYVIILIASLFLIGMSFIISFILFYFGILIFIFPYIHLYAKAVDEGLMVKKVGIQNLTEGDWLYSDIKIGNKIIRATWAGLTKEDIYLLKRKDKNRKIKIRQGIPFSPVFLISFVIWGYLLFF